MKILRFLKRLPAWIKLCWNQEDWDYGYIYDLLEFKLKKLQQVIEQDTIHEPKDVNRSVRQIKICLQYLDRFRNWPEYYDYPMDDIKWVEGDFGLCMKSTNSINEAKRKHATAYEQFNYEMFWKRFLQWHRSWWV